MILPDSYSMRLATAKDAAVLAQFRAEMFQSFGLIPEDGWEACWTNYFSNALQSGVYWAILAEHQAEAVACAGLMFTPIVPSPSDVSGLRAHVEGVFTVPEHRGHGLGEALTRLVLEEAQRRGIKSAKLNTTVMGQPLYERLGFTPAKAPELRLNLAEAAL